MGILSGFAVSGYNDNAIATNAYSILNSAGSTKLGVTSGRVLFLESLSITNTHASAKATVKIYDEAEAASPTTPTAANQRYTVVVSPGDTAMIEFSGKGLKFITGCCATQSGGTIGTYCVTVTGVEK